MRKPRRRNATWLRERILWASVLAAASMFFTMLFIQMAHPSSADSMVSDQGDRIVVVGMEA